MRDPVVVFRLFLAAMAFGVVGAVMARNRRLSTLVGFVLGFCFGPLGYIAISLLAGAKGRPDVSFYARIVEMGARREASRARRGDESDKIR